MRTIYTLMMACLTGLCVHAQPGWFKEYIGNFNDKVTSVTYDANGNLYVAGNISPNGSFGSGTNEVWSGFFVAKYNGSGQVQWVKYGRGKMGWSNETQAFVSAVAVNGNDLYVTGDFKDSLIFGSLRVASHESAFVHNEMYLMKLHAGTGDVISGNSFSGGSDASLKINSMKCDASGNVFIGGSFVENIDFGSGKSLTCWTGLYGELFVAGRRKEGERIAGVFSQDKNSHIRK